jgi:hypothetical protein
MGPKAWIRRLRSLGQALVELLQAEVDALNADLKGSARELGRGVALLMFAAFLAFWVLGGLAYGSVEVVAMWLPRWGAIFVVTGVWALVAGVLALLGRSRLRRLETPVRTVQRHFASHQAFVREELLGDGEEEVVYPSAASTTANGADEDTSPPEAGSES